MAVGFEDMHPIPRKAVAYRQGGVTSRTDLRNRNLELVEQRMADLLVTFGALRRPVSESDRPLLLRKMISSVLRPAVDRRSKRRLLPVLVRYLPGTFSGWRNLFSGSPSRDPASSPLAPQSPGRPAPVVRHHG